MKKKICSIICLFFSLVSLCIPAFASDTAEGYYWTNQPMTYIAGGTSTDTANWDVIHSQAVRVFTRNSSYDSITRDYFYYIGNEDIPDNKVVVALYCSSNNTSTPSNSKYRLVFLSEKYGFYNGLYYAVEYSSSYDNYVTKESFSLSDQGSYGSYYRALGSTEYYLEGVTYNTTYILTNIGIPIYDSLEEACAALADALTNGVPQPPPSYETHNASFTLPAGNVAFIDFGSSGQNYKVEMRTTFPFNSDLFSGQFSPVSQKWGWVDSLPTSSGALSSAGQYVVPWYKTEPYNLLKQSKSAYVTSQTMVANGFWNETTSSRYLVINNPYFNTVSADTTGNPVLNNGNITVSVENAVSVRILSATDSLTTTGIQADVNPEVYYEGTFTDSGDTEFTNQDGIIASPEYGGNNYVPPAASAESLAEQIKNILNDLVSKITTIFTATHDAILRLVSAAQDFFGVFGLLYAWIPSEVYSVLQSGMIVAITIGIFKVFL